MHHSCTVLRWKPLQGWTEFDWIMSQFWGRRRFLAALLMLPKSNPANLYHANARPNLNTSPRILVPVYCRGSFGNFCWWQNVHCNCTLVWLGVAATMIFGLIYAAAQDFPVCFHQCCWRDGQKQIWQPGSRRPSERTGCKVNWQWE